MLDENSEDGNICLALWLYNKLLQYEEDILDANDFGKDEILEGLRELEALKLPQ